MQEKPNALSVIENIEVNQVESIIAKINQFQQMVQRNLKEGHDYGVIPGTSKPTLLKPGAEKILMMTGVTSEYEIIKSVEDYNKGFFAYSVKCILSRNGQVITNGFGHANTKEKRYKNQDPFTLTNTVLKMAKKRAQIDATLTIASLSEVFTQDLEDMEPVQKSESKPRSRNMATANQARKILALANELELTAEQQKKLISTRYDGKTSLKKLTKDEASDCIDYLEKIKNGEESLDFLNDNIELSSELREEIEATLLKTEKH